MLRTSGHEAYESLRDVFSREQVNALVQMSTRVSAQLREEIKEVRKEVIDWAAIRSDLSDLREAVTNLARSQAELARAQARTEARVEELAQAQARTEERVEELAQAQARTEERVGGLERAVERLAQAQARTEERVGGLERAVERLAQAQARTEERVGGLERAVERLAQAQARTEERVERLEKGQAAMQAAIQELAQAQARTEEEVRILSLAFKDLRTEVGRLADTIGLGLEDLGSAVLPAYLDRTYGIRGVEFSRRFFTVDGKEVEINLYGEGERDGEKVILLGEAKNRIKRAEVRRFIGKLTALEDVFDRPLFRFMFGFWIHPSAFELAEQGGIELIVSYKLTR